jgi:hypothetical protein
MATRPGYIWSGTEWVSIGQEATVNPFAYQASEPISPATGDVWIDSDDTIPTIDSAQFLRWRKTVAGGETSLSGNDDTSLPLQYTAGYEQLYINGVLQVRTLDYVATTGTTITGLTALALNDVVEIFSVVARLVGDVYTQAQADAKYATQATVSALPTSGLVLINTTTFSAVASQSVNNVFSATYDNYKIVINYKQTTGSQRIRLRYRVAGSDDVTSNNRWVEFQANSNGATGVDFSYIAETSTVLGAGSPEGNTQEIIISQPFLGEFTRHNTTMVQTQSSTIVTRITSGTFLSTTSFTGFTIFPDANTITGTVSVYGLAK